MQKTKDKREVIAMQNTKKILSNEVLKAISQNFDQSPKRATSQKFAKIVFTIQAHGFKWTIKKFGTKKEPKYEVRTNHRSIVIICNSLFEAKAELQQSVEQAKIAMQIGTTDTFYNSRNIRRDMTELSHPETKLIRSETNWY
jgi:ribosomal protein L3